MAIPFGNRFNSANDDGWISIPSTVSWTYASATTINVPSGAASLFQKGDKIKLTQTTTKYFSVVAVTNTLLTVTGGSDYSVANAAISNIFYSHSNNAIGFPTLLTVTMPVFTASGTSFTNQPTNWSGGFSINGGILYLFGLFHTNTSGTGTGIWTLTYTTGQLPDFTYSGAGFATQTGVIPIGSCLIQQAVNNVLKTVKFDGTTVLASNNTWCEYNLYARYV